MRKYMLLEDLPFAKAGDIFREMHGDGTMVLAPEEWDQHRQELYVNEIENFDEWFEEVEEPKWIYYIDAFGGNVSRTMLDIISDSKKNMEAVGNCFETREEAEKYLEYLKAKAIIKQDTKGFKPNWKNPSQKRFFGYYNLIDKKLCYFNAGENMESKIYFSSKEDIKESFEKNHEEWKTYLTYEQ